MQGCQDWRSTIAITCSLAVVVAVVVWNLRKNSSSSKKTKKCNTEDTRKTDKISETADCQNGINQNGIEESVRKDTIPELPNPRWTKVGQVKELYLYPLKSGRGKDVNECNFTEYGISIESDGRLTIRDRMFLVYNEETRRFQTGRNYPTMILVSLSAVDKSKVKLEAVGMPSVIVNVPKNTEKSSEAIECKMWWGETVKCIDCGSEAAEWLSRFLTGTNSGLRLGYAAMKKRTVANGPWEKYTKVYKAFRDEDMGLFCDLTSYMLMTAQSLDTLNEKLERPVPALQFRPNILVSGPDPFAEDNWEWIKIGEQAVIRNIKPCTRCKLVRVSPETGIMDKEEPTKTLQSFREENDPERIALDGKTPLMGIYCGLYLTGKVKVGDDVFVHMTDDSSKLIQEEITSNNQTS